MPAMSRVGWSWRLFAAPHEDHLPPSESMNGSGESPITEVAQTQIPYVSGGRTPHLIHDN